MPGMTPGLQHIVDELELDPVAADKLWRLPHFHGTWADAYEVLIGAAFCLEKCKRALDRLTIADKENYVSVLFPDLAGALQKHLSGDKSSRFPSWTSEFYLNRAQHSVAAAVDRCVNAIITGENSLRKPEMKITVTAEGSPEGSWGDKPLSMYTWVGVRLEFLCLALVDKPDLHKCMRAMIGGLKAVDEQFRGRDLALTDVGRGVDPSCLGKNLESHIGNLWLPYSRIERGNMLSRAAECEGFCIARTNQWKHLPLGTSRKLPPDQKIPLTMAEWVWTVEAFAFAVHFWKTALSAYGVSVGKKPLLPQAE